jgi:hypothetical protein
MTQAAPLLPASKNAPATEVSRVQARLTLGPSGGPHEQEADRIAEAVLADRPRPLTGPLPVTPLVQRQDEKDDEDEEEIQTKAAAPHPAPRDAALSEAAAAVSTGGRPLSRAERDFFEPRFGRDFGAVRLHDGPRAAAAARGIGARAYTLGRSIAFAPGQYDAASREGRRLMAHELTHTLQQGHDTIRRDDPPPVRPTQITFSFDPTKAIPVGAGGTAALTATTDGTPITWSMVAGTAAVAAGTAISATGTITLAADQSGGSLTVHAENDAGTFERDISVAAVPTGIDSTAVSSDLNNAASHYGAAFQHTFTSAQGSENVLENLRIGEKFPTVPSPNAALHVISGANWPFGRGLDRFELSTGTRNADGTGGWALDSAGQFGPAPAGGPDATGDNLSTAKILIKVGDHVQSASNASPRNRLPVTLTLDQEFHFFNPRATGAARWTRFTTTATSRTLRRSGSDVQFVTTVNGEEHVQDYEGKAAVTNLTASPVNTPKSTAPPPAPPGGAAAPEGAAPGVAPAAPPPRTVSLSVETLPGTLPAGASLNWSFVGDALGCTLTEDPTDETRATMTVGTTAGTVTVQVAEDTGTNFDRVSVRIT